MMNSKAGETLSGPSLSADCRFDCPGPAMFSGQSESAPIIQYDQGGMIKSNGSWKEKNRTVYPAGEHLCSVWERSDKIREGQGYQPWRVVVWIPVWQWIRLKRQIGGYLDVQYWIRPAGCPLLEGVWYKVSDGLWEPSIHFNHNEPMRSAIQGTFNWPVSETVIFS